MLCAVGIVIGFDPNNYSINEDVGTVNLTLKLLEGHISENKNILVMITTADDSTQGRLTLTT